MLKYKIDVYDALKRKGFTTYKAKTTNLLSQNTLNKIKNEDTAITLKALNAVCNILEMQPGQLLEYVRDEEDEKKLKELQISLYKGIKMW